MSEVRNAAFLNSQVACAMIEAMGMQAENQQRAHRGEAMAYNISHFLMLLDRYGIHHNAALITLEQP